MKPVRSLTSSSKQSTRTGLEASSGHHNSDHDYNSSECRHADTKVAAHSFRCQASVAKPPKEHQHKGCLKVPAENHQYAEDNRSAPYEDCGRVPHPPATLPPASPKIKKPTPVRKIKPGKTTPPTS
jgi:hypothetical protein